MNDLLKLKLAVTIIINYYYKSDKMKIVFDSFKKMIKIDIKENINFDKSTQKICLISDIQFSIILIKIKIERNIDLIYFYS